jgi:hypothetical protein
MPAKSARGLAPSNELPKMRERFFMALLSDVLDRLGHRG